jgi:hypothetical protein
MTAIIYTLISQNIGLEIRFYTLKVKGQLLRNTIRPSSDSITKSIVFVNINFIAKMSEYYINMSYVNNGHFTSLHNKWILLFVTLIVCERIRFKTIKFNLTGFWTKIISRKSLKKVWENIVFMWQNCYPIKIVNTILQ